MSSINLKLFSFTILFLTIVFTSCNVSNKKSMEVLNEKSYLEVIVGTYTKNESKGIYKLIINTETGALLHKTLLVDSNNPSYLAISKDKKYVYAVQENEKGEIVGYKWNEDNTKLIEISRLSTKGMHPCYISLNKDNSLLSIGNYSSGDIAVYKVHKDGVLNDSIQTRSSLFVSSFGGSAAPVNATIFFSGKILGLDPWKSARIIPRSPVNIIP